MKTKFFNICRKIFFQNPLGEKWVAKMISKYPNVRFYEKLPPNPYQYKKNSFRTVERKGIAYLLDLSDYQEWLVFYNVSADSSLPLLQFLESGDTVLDVGGNIGQTALNASLVVGSKGHIYTFEPFPDSYNKLVKNLQLNPTITNIIPSSHGLGSKVSTEFMEVPFIENSGGNRVSKGKGVGTKIEITTIDRFVIDNHLDQVNLIKIDVEGFEMEVLKGAAETLKKHRPCLYIEINSGHLALNGDKVIDLFQFVISYGYSIWNMKEQTMIIEMVEGNYLDAHFDIFCTSIN